MTAIHTPGHASDHLCFARDDGILFSADHVMSWSSSIVSPPYGDMAGYFRSLELMLARDDRLYLPGHGPPLPDPKRFVRALLDHRLAREQAIETSLDAAPMSVPDLADRLYAKTDPLLRRAAERNVLAHLLKLAGEGRVAEKGEVWISLLR
jgi:glyoxylase-like metal-dependent hydrolase (beta-lactamase superfamily II)